MSKKTYKIPVHWSCCADIEVEAENLKEAIQIAKEADLPPQDEWEYIDSSWEVNVEAIPCLNPEAEEEYNNL